MWRGPEHLTKEAGMPTDKHPMASIAEIAIDLARYFPDNGGSTSQRDDFTLRVAYWLIRMRTEAMQGAGVVFVKPD